MFEDLADLFQQSAADGTPIREIVGEDPMEFVEAFAQNYSKGGCVTRERERLVDASSAPKEKRRDALITAQPTADRGQDHGRGDPVHAAQGRRAGTWFTMAWNVKSGRRHLCRLSALVC